MTATLDIIVNGKLTAVQYLRCSNAVELEACTVILIFVLFKFFELFTCKMFYH